MARATAPSLPLTSLTQASTRSEACCAECGSTRLTRIEMTLTDGSPVTFSNCLACEHRTWEQSGRALSLKKVLAKATKER